jgi:fatty-acyl-CoA synthase
MHPDGYTQIMDRKKDIIIRGGENISTVEIENVIFQHPDVLEVAVIPVPDPKWAEVTKAATGKIQEFNAIWVAPAVDFG